MRYDLASLDHDLGLFKSVADAEQIIGGFSQPGKMPWLGWSISAHRCNVGGKLAKIPGSVCHGCYALKGRYVFNNVQTALERRYTAHENPLFVPAFVFAVRKKAKKIAAQRRFFRLFDSGDLQSVDMLFNFNAIALATPMVRYWLPTRESTIVRDFLHENGEPAPNLTVRLSANMIDNMPPGWWPIGSAVFTQIPQDKAKRCPAPSQGNQCLDCRTCWDNLAPLVTYHTH